MTELNKELLLKPEIKTLTFFSIVGLPISLLSLISRVGGCFSHSCHLYSILIAALPCYFYIYVLFRVIYVISVISKKLTEQKKFNQWFTVLAFFIANILGVIFLVQIAVDFIEMLNGH